MAAFRIVGVAQFRLSTPFIWETWDALQVSHGVSQLLGRSSRAPAEQLIKIKTAADSSLARDREAASRPASLYSRARRESFRPQHRHKVHTLRRRLNIAPARTAFGLSISSLHVRNRRHCSGTPLRVTARFDARERDRAETGWRGIPLNFRHAPQRRPSNAIGEGCNRRGPRDRPSRSVDGLPI
jgi:hypothetical protein